MQVDIDYDLKESLKYASFLEAEIDSILARDDGENDGAHWVFVFKLTNGRYGYLEAGCDYTGWG